MTPEQKVDAINIGYQMNRLGFPKQFVADAVSTALNYEGVYDLMKLWAEESDEEEKANIVADITELIDDCQQHGVTHSAYVRFDDLEAIGNDIRAFKDSLRNIVDNNGGITQLSEMTGIPQPSLSRFFNSASRPRRSMLFKIAKALNLSQVQISTQWSK